MKYYCAIEYGTVRSREQHGDSVRYDHPIRWIHAVRDMDDGPAPRAVCGYPYKQADLDPSWVWDEQQLVVRCEKCDQSVSHEKVRAASSDS